MRGTASGDCRSHGSEYGQVQALRRKPVDSDGIKVECLHERFLIRGGLRF